ncbi:MAG: hypothetical protein ACREQB_02410 [Candidatus Binataceae bacterium]
MNPPLPAELHLLLDRDGSLIVFQQKDASWAGLLAFTTEERARAFCATSHLEVAEIVAISSDDRESIARLIAGVKRRAVRNLLLDLDYATGRCARVEFDGDSFGPALEHQFAPAGHRR